MAPLTDLEGETTLTEGNDKMDNKPHCIGEIISPTAALEESDSDDDDLLNFVAFPKKKEAQSGASPISTATIVEEIEFSPSRSMCSPSKVSQDVEEEKPDCVEKDAEKRVRLASIPDSIKSPSELYWQTRTKKGKIIHEPCRECHPDEALGLDIEQNWDPEQKVVVQYIEWCTLNDRALVNRNSLTPYHGGNYKNEKERDNEQYKKNETPQWCNKKLELLKRQRRKRAWTLVQVLTEKLYLQRILDHAIEMHDQVREVENKEEKDVIISSQVRLSQRITKHKDGNTENMNSDSSGEDDSEVVAKTRKTELLRCGDVIEYYSPIFVFGDERGLQTATIVAINSKASPVLELSSGDVLPIETLVKRVQVMFGGKLHDNQEKGKYHGIQWYKLRTDVKNSGKSPGIKKQAKRFRDIIVESQEKFKRKVQKSGLGDCTEMMNFK